EPCSSCSCVEHPSPDRKKTGTTEQSLLTNHKPEPHVRRFHPSPPRWPRRSLYTASHPCPSLVGCLHFPHAVGPQRDTGLAAARWSKMSAP
uniref:Tumor necrosis factor alpha-induced protein 2 n=1 Tax=Mesocestoides corti TaxID=53468 RepID=A0A5K3EGR4_MESCO